jgi:isopentenyl-diphosphate delta-isomerase
MEEEQIDEFDAKGNIIATHPRSALKKRMFLHKVSLVIPTAKGGKLILSKRAKDKHPYPSTWCCAVGGKTSSGEAEESAAIREMKEEIGKAVPIKRVASFIYDKDDYKGIFTVFTTKTPILVQDLKPDKSEIELIKAFSAEEIREMIKEDPKQFAPTFLPAIMEFVK